MMTLFTNNRDEIELVISGYIRELGVDVGQDIEGEIERQFVDYHFNATKLFDCTKNEFRDIVSLCINVNHPSINTSTLFGLLATKSMNGERFCALSKRNWCLLLQTNSICSTGSAYKLWKKIYGFDFRTIQIGLPIYLSLH